MGRGNGNEERKVFTFRRRICRIVNMQNVITPRANKLASKVLY
jgi:hypothetical protein